MKTTELRPELHPYNLWGKDEGPDKDSWVGRNRDLLNEESGYQNVTDPYTSPYETVQ